MELCYKAQESELGQLTESLIQNVLICGIKDFKLRERLFMQPDLNLPSKIQAGQATEDTKVQTKILDTTSKHKPAEIANIRSSKHYEKMAKKYKTHHPGNDRNPAKTQNYINACNYCGSSSKEEIVLHFIKARIVKRKDSTLKCVGQRKKKIQTEVSPENSDLCIEHMLQSSIEAEGKKKYTQ